MGIQFKIFRGGKPALKITYICDSVWVFASVILFDIKVEYLLLLKFLYLSSNYDAETCNALNAVKIYLFYYLIFVTNIRSIIY